MTGGNTPVLLLLLLPIMLLPLLFLFSLPAYAMNCSRLIYLIPLFVLPLILEPPSSSYINSPSSLKIASVWTVEA